MSFFSPCSPQSGGHQAYVCYPKVYPSLLFIEVFRSIVVEIFGYLACFKVVVIVFAPVVYVN